jgi:hypothetical protein
MGIAGVLSPSHSDIASLYFFWEWRREAARGGGGLGEVVANGILKEGRVLCFGAEVGDEAMTRRRGEVDDERWSEGSCTWPSHCVEEEGRCSARSTMGRRGREAGGEGRECRKGMGDSKEKESLCMDQQRQWDDKRASLGEKEATALWREEMVDLAGTERGDGVGSEGGDRPEQIDAREISSDAQSGQSSSPKRSGVSDRSEEICRLSCSPKRKKTWTTLRQQQSE